LLGPGSQGLQNAAATLAILEKMVDPPASTAPFAEDSLGIKDLIRRVRVELTESHREREDAGEPPLFVVQDLTVEANFVVTKAKSGQGGLDLKIITVGGGRHVEHQQVHKLTLTLAVAPGLEMMPAFA
jgi:Trypsin-co-occurring domain 2